MKKPWLFAFALTFAVWMFLSTYWFSILDGDSALYPLMSIEVLRGHHFLYTLGQSHGGTPLVYLRAAIFSPLLNSQWRSVLPQLNILITGAVAALAVALWTHFCTRLSRVLNGSNYLAPSTNSEQNIQVEKSAGRAAGYSFAICAALGSTFFAQYSTTDYYILALVLGGISLNLALSLGERAEVSRLQSLLFGLLTGFGFYVCRFTPLYTIAAAGAFVLHSSAVRTALLTPSLKEILNKRTIRGKISKIIFYALVVNTSLAVLGFFSNDHFLGINAESASKTSIKIAFVLWLLHRGRILIESPLKALFAGTGFLIGIAPHLYFSKLNPAALDRTTGLVRWQDLTGQNLELTKNLGLFFSRPHPIELGISCVVAIFSIFALAVIRRRRQTKQLSWLIWAFLFSTMCIASWLLVHTYMHAVPQYFYPAYFPFLLLAAIAASVLWKRGTVEKILVLTGIGVLVSASLLDLRYLSQQKNIRLSSQVFETIDQWKSEGSLTSVAVTGDFWSTYDMMWAQYARPANVETYIFSPLFASRNPVWHDQILKAKTLAYVFHNGEAVPAEKQLYKTLKTALLENGYSVELLERR